MKGGWCFDEDEVLCGLGGGWQGRARVGCICTDKKLVVITASHARTYTYMYMYLCCLGWLTVETVSWKECLLPVVG